MKNYQDNKIQNITVCNVYFSTKVYTVYNGVWGKAPRSWGVFENFFSLKVTLQYVNTVLQGSAAVEEKLLALQYSLLYCAFMDRFSHY